MNDGRIMAADLHYYANSGNTADESLLVSHSSSAFHRSSLNPKSSLTPNTRRCLYACHRQCLSSLPPPFLQVIEKILLHLDNAYNVPNLRGRSVACKTNLPSNTAFGGFGVPQSMLVTENMINDVAMKLGCNAEEVRGEVLGVREGNGDREESHINRTWLIVYNNSGWYQSLIEENRIDINKNLSVGSLVTDMHKLSLFKN